MLAFLFAAAGLVLDRITKAWAVSELAPSGSIPLIERVFHLTYVENRGAAFGVLEGQRMFLLIVTGIAMCAVIWEIIRKRKTGSPFYLASLGLILGGGLGNLIDRASQGYVVDFFDFRLINFAVFNVADICAVCGVILFAAYLLFEDVAAKRKASAPDGQSHDAP